MITVVLKLAWSAYIYIFWRECNDRQIKGVQASENEIIKYIKDSVQARLQGKRIYRNDTVNVQLCIEWGTFWLLTGVYGFGCKKDLRICVV